MGSEFAFEDLASFEVEKYNYEYLRDETVNGMDSYLVKYTPNYKKLRLPVSNGVVGQKRAARPQNRFLRIAKAACSRL